MIYHEPASVSVRHLTCINLGNISLVVGHNWWEKRKGKTKNNVDWQYQGLSYKECIRNAENREKWRSTTFNLLRADETWWWWWVGHMCNSLNNTWSTLAGSKDNDSLLCGLGTNIMLLYHSDISSTPGGMMIYCFCRRFNFFSGCCTYSKGHLIWFTSFFDL